MAGDRRRAGEGSAFGLKDTGFETEFRTGFMLESRQRGEETRGRTEAGRRICTLFYIYRFENETFVVCGVGEMAEQCAVIMHCVLCAVYSIQCAMGSEGRKWFAALR